jgi:glycosyltransferase involved in cell wall biosynthesis
VILEALASQLSTIAPTYRDIGDTVDDRETDLLVEQATVEAIADNLVLVAADAAARLRLSGAGRRSVEHFAQRLAMPGVPSA